ncbi:hypothetical protein DM02DRAFT_668204 [Periconia macrospinosa]|uniref:Zn(2)-C6 fungal-type domain-containing protein n=1 Tax=Periconia macrospinosa TaxID=97972 RepID=A0A2V1E4T5_9PLEO|nr:hypothetical protein DM02DRAFT_668204 [Periconia macrospinosa]
MEATVPRRILRKGTTSCVECKRRKIRCFFDQNSSVTCVSCRNRGTPCFGQDAADAAVPRDWENSERLKRVERMLQDLTAKFMTQGFSPESMESQELSVSDGGGSNVFSLPERRAPNALSARDQLAQPTYSEACQLIHAAFPSQLVVDCLFEAGRATIYLQALCNPYRQLFTEKNTQSSMDLAQIPPVSAHPVLLARKLLHLALCMQQLDPSFDRSQLQGIPNVRECMNNYYELASRLVTCHDELLDSREGLECLVCEAVFLTNGGNLRQALAALRRATTVAQMMHLHRKPHNIPLKQLDPNTRVSGPFIWQHIAYLERYISLLIGMPSTIANTQFDTGPKKDAERDEEWFERSQIDLCNRIISRNQHRNYEIAVTMEIDKLLNEKVAQTPDVWWSPLEFGPGLTHEEMMSRMISAQMQIIHYNMVTVLHLPHLLSKDTPDQRFDYSRYTCLYASREVLIRFIAFRSHIKVVYCCRPVDFCALTACKTLLLAYLNGNGESQAFDFAQQRAQDLDLIKRTLDMLDELWKLNGDELSAHTAKLTRKLVELEETMGHQRDNVVANVVDHDEAKTGSDAAHGPDCLYLNVPYFGCIKLSIGAAPNITGSVDPPYSNSSFAILPFEPPGTVSGQQYVQITQPIYDMATFEELEDHLQGWDWPMPDLLAGSEDWAFQGTDATFFDTIMGGYNEGFSGQGQWNEE